MKNLLYFLKIFLLSAVIIFPVTCQADYYYTSTDITNLKSIVGNWYDAKGNLVFTISNDYKLNGCQVMSVEKDGDFYRIRINEGNRYRNIELVHSGISDDHESLIWENENNIEAELGNAKALRRTKNPRYFESIGGIYLGMDPDEVLRLYGKPSSKVDWGGGVHTVLRLSDEENFDVANCWRYDDLGLEVSVFDGVVSEIIIYSNGDRKFDRSGLSARNSEQEFERKYNAKSRGVRGIGRCIDIGHGETIAIRSGYEDVPASVVLF